MSDTQGNLAEFNPYNYNFINQGIKEGLFKIEHNYIYYIKSKNHKERFTKNDPEELTRAEIYLELITKYKYDPKNIDVEVSVTIGSSKKSADIIVWNPEKTSGKQQAFLIVECKKADISEAEFEQAVKQANSYAKSQGAKYAVTASGQTIEVVEATNETKFDKLMENTIVRIPVAVALVKLVSLSLAF